MNTDWMAWILGGLVGACVGWGICSLWTVRWIDRERRLMRQQYDEQHDPALAEMGREIERLRMQETFNRERA